jgi:cation-transporting P-type ATPase 13A2
MLIRSILYSSPRKHDFFEESYWILLVTFSIASIAMGTVLPTFIDNFSTYHTVIRTLNALTVSIPAVLPVAMSVGILFAYGRLYISQIYCTQPRRIDSAGRVATMVFDKTGTLTNEGLNAIAIQVSNPKGFEKTIYNPSEAIESNESWRNPNQYESDRNFNKFIE